MSIEIEDQGTGRSTVARTIRLSSDMVARLQVVSDHLGVTIGAYLTHAVGASVCKDEIALSVKQSNSSSLELLGQVMEQMHQISKD